jgi:hypothetical protein
MTYYYQKEWQRYTLKKDGLMPVFFFCTICDNIYKEEILMSIKLDRHIGHKIECIKDPSGIVYLQCECGDILIYVNDEDSQTATLREDILNVMNEEDFELNEEQIQIVIERMKSYSYSDYNEYIADTIRDVIEEAEEC